MKLTILALALSTYCCGASSRKLPAVAEAEEEDYYYDGEVNTYYDDADADDTSVELRAPISGVDGVPAQIGTLLEGVLGPFLGTFQGLETPIVVRYASLIDALSWNCIATYHDSWRGAVP